MIVHHGHPADVLQAIKLGEYVVSLCEVAADRIEDSPCAHVFERRISFLVYAYDNFCWIRATSTYLDPRLVA